MFCHPAVNWFLHRAHIQSGIEPVSARACCCFGALHLAHVMPCAARAAEAQRERNTICSPAHRAYQIIHRTLMYSALVVWQGLGRHSERDINLVLDEGLAALSAILGDKRYLLGAQPCTADACAFGFLDKCAPRSLEEGFRVSPLDSAPVVLCDESVHASVGPSSRRPNWWTLLQECHRDQGSATAQEDRLNHFRTHLVVQYMLAACSSTQTAWRRICARWRCSMTTCSRTPSASAPHSSRPSSTGRRRPDPAAALRGNALIWRLR